ncbi:MAG: nitrate ABC transporter substrate-binding protein [Curvibacter sp. PD_MW3]|nr:MAG: nitrate ABC transporter substrate-binding protein [Curvibacter sp. PD_MW3]
MKFKFKTKEANRLRKLSVSVLLALGLCGQATVALADVLPSINLQLTPWTVIARAKGVFKEEFGKVGTKEVNLIASGGAELVGAETAAVSKGAISIAQRMIYPATVHRANGLDGVIVWASEPSNRYRAPILAAANNKSINSLADLDGKKFGSSRISCYWSSPFEALNAAGLPLDTRQKKGRVRYESIDNPTVAVAGVISGAVDATTVHLAAGNATGAWLSGKLKVVGHSPDDGVYVNHAGRVTYFAKREFVNKYPDAVKAFLASRERTMAWALDNVDEAAKIVAKELRLPLDVAKFQITHKGQWEFMAGEANADRARNSIKTFQSWYINQGDDILAERRLSDAQIDAFVDSRFFVGGSHSIYR